mmetsp:Transcript_15609/g.42783  ORF Transcript_15609/g.42783 Transcript_15609/m.42783 type:complete len:133 (-) Transcript_15609:162-560(-)
MSPHPLQSEILAAVALELKGRPHSGRSTCGITAHSDESSSPSPCSVLFPRVVRDPTSEPNEERSKIPPHGGRKARCAMMTPSSARPGGFHPGFATKDLILDAPPSTSLFNALGLTVTAPARRTRTSSGLRRV